MAAAARRAFEQQQQQQQQEPLRPPPRRGRAKPTAKQVSLCAAYLRTIQSAQHVRSVRANVAVLCIQDEFREYLERTEGQREMLRTRRLAVMEKERAQRLMFMNGVRENGRAIAMQEAQYFAHIVSLIVTERVGLFDHEEARIRQEIEGEEAKGWRAAFDAVAPDEWRDDTLVGQEYSGRAHIFRFEDYSRLAMMQSHWRVIISLTAAEERTQRLELVSTELRERQLFVSESRTGMTAVRIQECELIEQELRALNESQRFQFVNAAFRTRAHGTAAIICSNGEAGEGGARSRLLQREDSVYVEIMEAFQRGRFAIIAADLFIEEKRCRVGYGGIIAREQAERRSINDMVVRVQMLLLQNHSSDGATTPVSEADFRSIIEWTEYRERHALVHGLKKDWITFVVPREELVCRSRIEEQQMREWRTFGRSAIYRDVIVNVLEPAQRKEIFKTWCQFCFGVALGSAFLRLSCAEYTARWSVLQQQQVESEHLVSREYLAYLELKDRTQLRSYFQKSHRKRVVPSI